MSIRQSMDEQTLKKAKNMQIEISGFSKNHQPIDESLSDLRELNALLNKFNRKWNLTLSEIHDHLKIIWSDFLIVWNQFHPDKKDNT